MKDLEKTNQETEKRNPLELVKEAISRANKKEKKEWISNFERREKIGKRMLEIDSELERLEQMDKENKMPERRYLKENEIYTMSKEEIESYNEMLEEHNKEFSLWSEKSHSINSEIMKLNKERIGLMGDFFNLEFEEKWILLSIVLRSQPSLMKYI